MAEGRVDEYEMQDLGEKYSKYDEMNYGELVNEYYSIQDLLLNDEFQKNNSEQFRKYEETQNSLSKLIREKEKDSSFIESYDGKTVNIEKNPFHSTS